MSEIPAHPSDLDLRQALVQIDRQLAETRKFVAEHDKLAAEAAKLTMETRALRIMRWVTPTAAVIGAAAAILAAVPTINRILGG